MATAAIMQSGKKDLLDDMTKAFALLVSITYGIGLIIVNSFLLTFGVRTMTLLSVEYISAGLPLTLLFVVAGLTAAYASNTKVHVWPKIFIPVLALLLLSLIMLYITNLADYARTLRTTGIIFVALTIAFFVGVRHFQRNLVGNRERLIVWSAVYTLVFLAMVVVSSTFYGRTVYNDILPTVGGGAGNTISFVTDIENAQVLEQFVPMDSEQQTQQLRLIRETVDSYLVSLDGGASVSIDKDLVKAVIHHKTSGWEIRSSIFD